MTCEVAIMNKYAVVIAADSAVTSTDERGDERYSKGGNKIFQLSKAAPIGVMIFGSATLDGVPWEIIIKTFRAGLNDTTYGTLAEYSAAFFQFVKNSPQFFPQADLDKNYQSFINASALRLLRMGRDSKPLIDDATKPDADRKAAWDEFLVSKTEQLTAMTCHPAIDAVAYQQAVADVVNHVPADVGAYLSKEGLLNVVDVLAWFSGACHFFYLCHDSVLSGTGVVFSGFGDNQYFPEVLNYQVPGFVNRDFIYSKQDQYSCQIGHDSPSAIFQFAMTSSIDAFTNGIDLPTFSLVRDAYGSQLKAFVSSVFGAANVALPPDLDAQIATSNDAFCQDWVPKVYDLHYHPMKQVIASLPIEELSHLAETLIVLQSLKERVTSRRQSVGGPIDVAVITKSEGLVWIKRKHFFESEKNLRYVLRQRSLYN
jgi:hypothetical protein